MRIPKALGGPRRLSHLSLATLCAAVLAATVLPASALGFEPLSTFGSFGDGAGQLKQPAALALAPDGTAYVADRKLNRVEAFHPDGSFALAFGKGVNPQGGNVCTTACTGGLSDQSNEAIVEPEGITVGPEGNVFVSIPERRRINVYSSAGVFIRTFALPLPGQPIGLDFSAAGQLYVAVRDTALVEVVDASGTFQRLFGTNVTSGPDPNVCTTLTRCIEGTPTPEAGGFEIPESLAIAPSGEVLVSDPVQRRINVFTAEGRFVRAFGKDVSPVSPSNVCTTASGCKVGTGGSSAGAIARPSGLTISPLGEVFVADSINQRVEQFQLDGTFVRAFGEGVVDGSPLFQTCTSTCRQGIGSEDQASLSTPTAVAVDAHCALYASSVRIANEPLDFAHITRLGEPSGQECGAKSTPPVPPPPPLPPSVTPPSNNFQLGRLILNRKRGTATLLVSVPGPGLLILGGKGLSNSTGAANVAGTVKLPIKPIGASKRALAKKGSAKVSLNVTFLPAGGAAASLTKRVTLRLSAR